MYYDRVISKDLQDLISNGGNLRWLYDFVLDHEALDFLIGKNKTQPWISVYYGLSRILRIIPTSKNSIKINAAKAYEDLAKENNLDIYKTYKLNCAINFSTDLSKLLNIVLKSRKFHKYYNNKKEGFYQTMFSREYGLKAKVNNEFVIIDKESVIGYKDTKLKINILNPLQKKYRDIYNKLCIINPKKYGKDLSHKALGTELDFLGVNSAGDILLIEFKHGSNTSGIYLSPIQIGLYYDIFSSYINQYKSNFNNIVNNILEQKKEIKLLPPTFKYSGKINNIIPVLVISKYNPRSTALDNFKDVLYHCRKISNDPAFLSNIKIYTYDENGLKILEI